MTAQPCTPTALRAYYQPGEGTAQIVRSTLAGPVCVMEVPMRQHAGPDDTLGVMVDGREWLPLGPRPAHHPERY